MRLNFLYTNIKPVFRSAGRGGSPAILEYQRVCLFATSLMACVLLQGCSLIPVVEVNGQTALTYYGGSQLAFEEINKQLATMFPNASEPPRLLHYVLPQMTNDEKNQGYEGIVKAQFLVGRDGRVSEVRIPVSPAAPLTDAVVRAVSQWVFSPMIVDGAAKEFKLNQSYNLKLYP